MTEAQALQAIFERWTSTWPDLQPLVPFCFDGEILESATEWARVSVQHTTSRQMTLGVTSRRFERLGNIFVQLFCPAGAGVGRAARLAADVRTVFEARSIVADGEVVHTYAARTEEVPTDGAWTMRTVVVPMRYVETR